MVLPRSLLWVLLAMPVLAWAGSASLIRAQLLLAAPDGLATVIAPLPAETRVEVVERRGGWSRVRAGNREGWLRLLALRELHATLPAAGNVAEVFRADASDDPRVVAIAGFRGLPPPRPSAHALILAIADYGSGIPALPGVAHDADNAVLMARSLGVPDANTTLLRDQNLTLDGLRAALSGLDARVLRNDEVFLYFSGYGTRRPARDGCAEALLAADGQALMDDELQDRLQHLAAKARRLVVFLDAGHGGATLAGGRLAGKTWTQPGADTCEHPANALVRGLQQARPGEGKLNFVHIAAAGSDETARDDAGRGGLATLAWLDCLSGAARDTDGSAGLSASELAACAQEEIARQAAGQHLAVSGNAAMVLARPLLPTVDLPSQAAAVAALKDIYANRDDRRTVRLSIDQSAFRIAQDRVTFRLGSSHEGYVYLLMVGSDGKSFDLLFPNRRDERNHIRAGETWQLPRPGWAIRAGGPPGTDHILAVVSDNPRDFSALGMQAAGPFSILATSAGSMGDIQAVSASSAGAARPECGKTGEQRTEAVAAACSDAYGAELISLEEVE